MREVTRIVYESFDGRPFDNEALCAAYEKENEWRKLIGLTEQQVWDAVSGFPQEAALAEAIKTIGYRIAGMNKKKAAPKANPADKEPFLPHPVGPEEGDSSEGAGRMDYEARHG